MLVRQLTKQLTTSLNSALSGVASAITRVLIDLSPTSNPFYSLDIPVVFSGDFEIEFNFTGVPGSSFRNLTGAVTSNRYEILFLNTNEFTAFDAVEGERIVTVAGAPYTDGNLHHCKVTKVGGLQSLFLDRVLIGSKTMGVHNVIFETFGNKDKTSNRYEGIISNLKLTDVSTPANSFQFSLNQTTANAEINNGKTLTYNNISTSVRNTYTLIDNDLFGSELVFDVSPDSIVSGWTNNGDGSYTADGTSTNQSPLVWNTVGIKIGAPYQTVFKIIATNGVEAWVQLGDDQSTRNTGAGEYVSTLTSNTFNADLTVKCEANFAGTVSLAVKRKIEVV